MPALFESSAINPQQQAESSKKGFTLVELMITVAIIAIISAVGMVSYSQAQSLGKDAKRKQDLRSIAVALQLYYNSQNPKTYPVSSNWIYSTATQPWIGALNTNFINQMPKDPVNTGTTPWTSTGGFVYAYCADSTTCHSDCTGLNRPWFILAARLDNTTDKDNIANQDVRWCDGTLLRNKSGWTANRVFAVIAD
jgi:prepilin-type N-terminal cleavage/methylation domain-containing protein